MTVSEFIKWLQEFEDQDATVEVVEAYSDCEVKVSTFVPPSTRAIRIFVEIRISNPATSTTMPDI